MVHDLFYGRRKWSARAAGRCMGHGMSMAEQASHRADGWDDMIDMLQGEPHSHVGRAHVHSAQMSSDMWVCAAAHVAEAGGVSGEGNQ